MPAHRVLASLLLIGVLAPSVAWGHELWFQPPSGPKAATVRLTFADTPDPAEAERVAEIAHAKVWGDGLPLEVERQAQGLEARLPSVRPRVLSGYADRGVVDYGGDSFIITLAAYAQAKPIAADLAPSLGVDDDQLRLLLVADGQGGRKLLATWRGKPAAGIDVRTFLGDESSDAKTDINGEMPCPDFGKAGVSLLAQFREMKPGERDGKKFTHTRYKATLNLAPSLASEADASAAESTGTRPGTWAVGSIARGELGEHRHSLVSQTGRLPSASQSGMLTPSLKSP